MPSLKQPITTSEDQAVVNYGMEYLRATAHEWEEGDGDS